MSNSKNTSLIEHITNEIWKMFDILRGSIPTDDLQVILFLLSAYKDRLLKDARRSEYFGDINHDILDSISNDTRYRKLLEIYAPIIKFIPSDKLEYVLHNLENINPSDLEENFSEIFDNLLYRLSDAQGKYSGEFIQPLEITRFIMNLANLPDNATVYNPFAGLASFGTFLNHSQRYYAQEINQRTWALGMLRLMAFNNINFDYYDLDDSIEHWNNFGEFDLIVSNPPFGLKLSHDYYRSVGMTVDRFLIERSLESLPKSGQLICILPLGFLYRGGKEKMFREYLINEGFIDTIISLPSGLFKHTGIPTCIVVFKKSEGKSEAIRMVDASEFIIRKAARDKRLDDNRLNYVISKNEENEFLRFVSIEKLKEANYNLHVPRFFAKDFFGVALGKLVKNISGTKTQRGSHGKFIRIRDLKDDVVDNKLELSKIEQQELPLVGIRKIEETCLLLATRWKTLKPTLFIFESEPIYISNDIIALKIDEEKVNINYLVNELHAGYVKEQMDNYRIASVIPMIRKDDLFEIRIELPPIDLQVAKYNLKVSQYMSSKVAEINALNYEQSVDINDENSFLRHQIAGSLKNVRGAFNFIKKILEEKVKPEFPGLDTLKVDERRDSTFLTYMNIIERDLNSIHNSVNKVGDKIELMDLRKENFDLLLFIKDYVESLKIRANNFYVVSLDLDENAIKEFGIAAIHIEGDKDLLRKMFDNIIENAEKHAFKYGIVNENKIKIELLYNFEDFEVQIDFSNTGTPLPSSMTHDSMTRKGSSSGKNSGDGVGSWFANEVMKIHNGKFGYTDETGPEGIESEYVTTIELIFPIIPAI